MWLVGSVVLIISATLLPFGGMAPQHIPPAWCLRCGALWLTDAIANVALFVPFGLALAAQRRPAWLVVLTSLLLSAVVELLQSVGLPPGRSSALADIATNTLGGGGGALAWMVLQQERTRSARAAGRLAVGWCALALGVFTLSARALQPYDPSAADVRQRFSKSPFGHVPGHGWYEGITDSAAVGDTVVRRGWSGPVILSAGADMLPVAASVWVRSTDPLGGQLPLLFVHQRGDSAAWLQIAKLNDDAELTVRRTAWTWGLSLPSVVVPGVFRGRTVHDSSTVTLSAHVTSATLTLDAGRRTGTLRLTPLLGWSLIQPVFTVQSALAGFAEWCWVWFWLFPLAWWARRSGKPLLLTVGTSVLVGIWLFALPRLSGLSALSAVEWLSVVSALVCSAFVSSRLPSGSATRVREQRASAAVTPSATPVDLP